MATKAQLRQLASALSKLQAARNAKKASSGASTPIATLAKTHSISSSKSSSGATPVAPHPISGAVGAKLPNGDVVYGPMAEKALGGTSSGTATSNTQKEALKAIAVKLTELQNRINSAKSEKEKEDLEKEKEDLEKEKEDIDPDDFKLPRVEVTIDGIKYSLPKELVESSHFKNADEMNKSLIAYTWGAISDQGHDIKKVINALEIAAQQSDVYIKQQVRMFEDELSNSFGYIIEDYGVGKEVTLRQMDYTTADLEATEKLLARRTAELKEDLEYHSENLEIDKQNQLGRQLKEYGLRLDDTRIQLADAGLTFSSIRGRAEKLLEEAHKDVVEDIETKAARSQREMTITAQRQEQDILYDKEKAQTQASRIQQSLQDQLKQMQSGATRDITKVLREGEKFLGTDMMKGMMGKLGALPDFMNDFQWLGDIKASGLKEMQYSDVLQRAQGLLGSR
jgi:hypothetical protein